MSNFGTAVFTAVLNNAQLMAASKASAASLMGIGASATRAGGMVTSGLSVPLAVAGGLIIARSVQIENAWNEVRATYNEPIAANVEKAIRPHGELANAVDTLSQKYGLNRKEVIENLGTLSQMGYTGKKATDTLTKGLEFAVAAGIPLEEGLSTAVSLTNTFKLNAKDLEDSLRGLNKVENDTAASGQDLTDGLRRAGGAATALVGPGFSARDAIGSIAGGMAVFKGAGQETMRSADAMRAIFQRLYTTGPKVNKLFDKMGVSVKNADGSLRPFPELLGDIGGNFDKLNQQEQLQFTKSAIGVEFGPLFQLLIQDVNKGNDSLFKTARDGFADVEAGEAAFTRELKIRGESMQAVIGRIRASIDKLIDSAQPVIKEMITPLANGIANLVDKFSGASPAMQKFVILLGVALAAIGPLLLMVGLFSMAIAAISWPVVAVVVAIMGLVAGIAMLVKWLNAGSAPAEKLKKVLGGVGDFVKNNLVGAWKMFSDGLKALMPVLKVVGAIIGVVLVGAVMAFSVSLRIIGIVFKVVATIIGGIVNLIWKLFKWLFDILVGHSIIPDMVNGIVDWFKKMASWLSGVMNAIVTMVKVVWNVIKTVVTVVVKAIVDVVKKYLDTLKAFWQAVWNAIKSITQTVWNGIKTVITTVWNAIKSFLTSAINGFKTIWSNGWNAIKSTAQTVWNGIKSVFETMKSGLSALSTKFTQVKDAIGTNWGKLKELAAKPIRFVLDTVLNKGLIKGFNWISGKIGGPNIKDIPIGFARGGYTGPGAKYTPAGIVHKGEVVFSQEDVRRHGGVGAVERLRKFGLASHADGGVAGLPGYFLGGVVDGVKGIWDKVSSGVSSAVNWLKDMGAKLLPDLSGIGNSTIGQYAKAGALKLRDVAMAKLKSLWDSGGGSFGSATPASLAAMRRNGTGYKAMTSWLKANVKGAWVTSGYRPGAITATGYPSQHGTGRAIDIVPHNMTNFGKILNGIGLKNIASLIYSPAGRRQVQRGRYYTPAAITRAGHWDHIHWGMRTGGLVPGNQSGDSTSVRAEPGEFMFSKATVRRIGVANLRRANNSPDPLGVLAGAHAARQNVGRIRGLRNASAHAPSEFATGMHRQLASELASSFDASRIAPVVDGDYLNQTFNWTINNPVAERATESTQEQLRRKASLGLIGSRRSTDA